MISPTECLCMKFFKNITFHHINALKDGQRNMEGEGMMNVPHGPFKKKNTFKIGNGGRGVANTTLEKLLLKFMAELDEAHLRFLSRLLIMEAISGLARWS